MATIIDNAKEKTMLLEEFLGCTQKIASYLEASADNMDMESIVSEVGKRDKIIDEINMINELLDRANIEDTEKQSELDAESQLWFKLLDEIQQLERKNEEVMTNLQNGYMQKVKSSKDAVKVINAYTQQMSEGEPVSVDKSK